MCSTPSYPSVSSKSEEQSEEVVSTPTYADASVSKASTNVRNKTASLASRNINTTARGLLDDAQTQKVGLLGE